MSASVRDLVKDIQRQMRVGGLTPDQACELLSQGTALIGNCLEEITKADVAYAHVLLKHLDGTEAANRATIRAQTSEEYLYVRVAKDTRDFLMEAVRSLRDIVRSQRVEMQFTPR